MLTPPIVEGIAQYRTNLDGRKEAIAKVIVLHGAEVGQFAVLPFDYKGVPGALVVNEKKESLGCIGADSKTIGECSWSKEQVTPTKTSPDWNLLES